MKVIFKGGVYETISDSMTEEKLSQAKAKGDYVLISNRVATIRASARALEVVRENTDCG